MVYLIKIKNPTVLTLLISTVWLHNGHCSMTTESTSDVSVSTSTSTEQNTSVDPEFKNISNNLFEIPFHGNGLLTLDTLKRHKRDGVGGSSTAVIGALITKDATASDWETVNYASNDVPSSRGKRSEGSLLDFYKNQYDSSVTLMTPIANFITKVQQRFQTINHNVQIAEAFLLIMSKINPMMHRLMVLNPEGVKCDQVCDPTNGLGFGLVGFCSNTFCECDFKTGNYTQLTCPTSQTFDPVKLICKYPMENILCSDNISIHA